MRFLILVRSVGLTKTLKDQPPKLLSTSLHFFLKMAKIWVGRTTLNEEKKEDGLRTSKLNVLIFLRRELTSKNVLNMFFNLVVS